MDILLFLLAFLLIILGGLIATMGDILPRKQQKIRAEIARAARNRPGGEELTVYNPVGRILIHSPNLVISERTARLNRWRVRIGIVLIVIGILIVIVYYVVTPILFPPLFTHQ